MEFQSRGDDREELDQGSRPPEEAYSFVGSFDGVDAHAGSFRARHAWQSQRRLRTIKVFPDRICSNDGYVSNPDIRKV